MKTSRLSRPGFPVLGKSRCDFSNLSDYFWKIHFQPVQGGKCPFPPELRVQTPQSSTRANTPSAPTGPPSVGDPWSPADGLCGGDWLPELALLRASGGISGRSRARHIGRGANTWLSGGEVLLHMGPDVLPVVRGAACVRGEKLLANATGLSVLRGEAGAGAQRRILQHPARRPAGLQGARGKLSGTSRGSFSSPRSCIQAPSRGLQKRFRAMESSAPGCGRLPRGGSLRDSESPLAPSPPKSSGGACLPASPVTHRSPPAAPVTTRPEPVRSPSRGERAPVCSALSAPLSLGADRAR